MPSSVGPPAGAARPKRARLHRCEQRRSAGRLATDTCNLHIPARPASQDLSGWSRDELQVFLDTHGLDAGGKNKQLKQTIYDFVDLGSDVVVYFETTAERANVMDILPG